MITKDFNKFNLANAMLKENYDSGSSNPSSYNTMKTGKKTLKERVNRRLEPPKYGEECKDSLNKDVIKVHSHLNLNL